MTQMHPDTVAIRQLRLKSGTATSSARLRQGIEWADWPAAPGESWVFIRQLQARAPLDEVVPRLLLTARDQLHGGSGDNVVRFANLTAMLAALLADLVRGTAAGRWYWQRWSRLLALPLPQAVASLLLEHLAHLPAICAELSRQRTLEPVWLALNQAGADQLRQALARRGGYGLPPWAAVQQAPDQLWPTPPVEVPLRINATVRSRWEPLLQRLPAADARHQLGLLLIGQEVAPLMLQHAPAVLLARLSRVLGRHDPVPVASHGAAVPGGSVPEQPALPATAAASGAVADPGNGAAPAAAKVPRHSAAAAKGSRPNPAPRSSQRLPAPVMGRAGSAAEIAGAAEPPAGEATIAGVADLCQRHPTLPAARQAALARSPFAALRPQPEVRDLANDQFQTRQGGLLYLLNLLNRSPAQALMSAFWAELPSGWGWLYRLGQELQLDATDPLVAFLATQLGFDHPRELGLLPPLPARDELLQLARRWYGRHELWQPALLQVLGRVHASPSHLELYAPLDAVRLPVRQAGLDINPGWLPWLGRVVIFHYD